VFYKGHWWEIEMSIEYRCVRLSLNPSGATFTAPISIFASQKDIEQTLDELIEKAESIVIKNDDAFFDPFF
jgi:hypothetical protein